MSLDHIDTAIAFITFLLMVSLLITSLVQLVLWTVNLRGTNLAWGINRLLNQIPGLKQVEAARVLKSLLEHPMLTTFSHRKITAIRQQELVDLLPLVVSKLSDDNKISADTVAKITAATTGFIPKWFEPVMDRTSEVFILWTRGITAVIAMVIAFGFSLDSVVIIRELSTNQELRAKLVAMADSTLKTSSEIEAGTKAASEIVTQAIADTIRTYKPAPGQPALPKLPEPTNLKWPPEGKDWLQKHLAGFADLSQVLAIYEEKVGERSKKRRTDLDAQAAARLDELKKTQLFSARFFGARSDGPSSPASEATLWGMLMTGVFLSLGAPFWHTTLRNVVALRPVVANKLTEEEKAVK